MPPQVAPRAGEVWAVEGPFADRQVRIIRLHHREHGWSVETYDTATGRLYSYTDEDLSGSWNVCLADPGDGFQPPLAARKRPAPTSVPGPGVRVSG